MEDQLLPEWMTNDFFNKCLRKKEGRQDIAVRNFTTSTVAPPGSNYGSFILRVKVEYELGDNNQELHSSSFIVKSDHQQGPMKDVMDDFQIEELKLAEPSFYYKFIPETKKFTNASFFPNAFFSPRPNVTVLEDLKEQGFVMANRLNQLDFDHCSLYMKAAATFHSVSVAVFRDHPEILEPIKSVDFYSKDSKLRGPLESMIAGGLSCFVDAIKETDRFNKYSGLIKNAIPDIFNMISEINEPSKFVNTIRQGDPWTTNMLFKYDKVGNVCDIKLVDFQALTYGTPLTDLLFFIWSSATNEVKRFKLKELYSIYLENFNRNLEQFKCNERLTYEQFEEEVRKSSPYTLYVAACLLPSFRDPEPTDFALLLSPKSDPAQVKNFYKKSYHEEYCSEYLPHLLECLESAGVFGYFESRSRSDN